MTPTPEAPLGDRPPLIAVAPPGPRSRELSRLLERVEAPAINTLWRGAPSVVWEQARGVNVRDVDGNVYLDLTAAFGVAAIGHGHPRIRAALAQQAELLVHGMGDVAAHPARIALAERLCAIAPVSDPVVHFAISGSDAVEVALKTALLATGRPGVLAFRGGYHGTTLGALGVTSREAFRRPFAAHLHPHVVHLPYGTEVDVIARELGARQGTASAIGAIVVEPIAGREGVLIPPAGWLTGLAAAARSAGALLVVDEILTGFGRTGRWFAVNAEGVKPDLLCCGKALGGGLPIAAVVGRRDLLACWDSGGEALHTATFLAHPLACVAALEALAVLESESLIDRARETGDTVLAPRLATWPARFPHQVVATRGRGMLWGVEMATAKNASRLRERLLALGVLVLSGGAGGTVVQLSPPLTIAAATLHHALDLFESLLASGDAENA